MSETEEQVRIEYLALSELQRWPRNPKAHDLETLALSVARFGFVAPLLIDERSGRLVAGHGRLDSLQRMKEAGESPPERIAARGDDWLVPVIRGVRFNSDVEAEAYLLADNRLAESGGWDEAALAGVLSELAGYDGGLDGLGWDRDDLERLLAGLVDDDAELPEAPGPQSGRAAELQEKWQTARGQLWAIASHTAPNGRAHRLLCGDSTDPEEVARLMDGERAVLFATDPPYLVDYDGTNHPHKWNEADKNKDWADVYHDWDDSSQGEELYDRFVAVAVEVAIVERAAWYCWHASRNQGMLERVWERYGAFVHQQIVWVKDRPVLTRSWYMWQHEPCFFGWVRGQKPKRIAEDYPPTVWQVPTVAPGTSTDHPTSKPVALFAIPMRQHSVPGEVCYEPFAGSGSQLVAGEQLGRVVYGLEIEPRFVAVILERLAEMGLEPELL